MKKRSFIIIIAALLAVTLAFLSASCGKKTDGDGPSDETTATGDYREIKDKNGNVKKRASYYPDGRLRYEEILDTNGRPVKYVGKNEDGTLDETHEITYNDDGTEYSYTTTKYSYEGGKLEEYAVNCYDGRRYITDSYRYDASDRLITASMYVCDELGRVTEERVYKEIGVLDVTKVFELDSAGRTVSETVTKSDGSFGSKTLYEYGEDGKMTRESNVDINGKVTSYCDYSYVEGSDTPETTIYMSDGKGGFSERK